MAPGATWASAPVVVLAAGLSAASVRPPRSRPPSRASPSPATGSRRRRCRKARAAREFLAPSAAPTRPPPPRPGRSGSSVCGIRPQPTVGSARAARALWLAAITVALSMRFRPTGGWTQARRCASPAPRPANEGGRPPRRTRANGASMGEGQARPRGPRGRGGA